MMIQFDILMMKIRYSQVVFQAFVKLTDFMAAMMLVILIVIF